MKYWSDLYAGDVEVITEAFIKARRADGPRILAHVALPGVAPGASGQQANTPDFLTDLAASIACVDGVTFSDAIAGRIARAPVPAEPGDGAYLMRPDWVSLFAGLTDSQVQAVAERWARERNEAGGKKTRPLTALVTSVRELCRVAIERPVPVVYTWTM
jgi:hypothetical protein